MLDINWPECGNVGLLSGVLFAKYAWRQIRGTGEGIYGHRRG